MRGDSHKIDHGKLMYDLIPPRSEEALAKVLTFGAHKYKPNGWKDVPDANNRYYAALRRHLSKHKMGERIDDETGFYHLEHALCNIVFLLELLYEEQTYDPYSDTSESRPEIIVYDSTNNIA